MPLFWSKYRALLLLAVLASTPFTFTPAAMATHVQARSYCFRLPYSFIDSGVVGEDVWPQATGTAPAVGAYVRMSKGSTLVKSGYLNSAGCFSITDTYTGNYAVQITSRAYVRSNTIRVLDHDNADREYTLGGLTCPGGGSNGTTCRLASASLNGTGKTATMFRVLLVSATALQRNPGNFTGHTLRLRIWNEGRAYVNDDGSMDLSVGDNGRRKFLIGHEFGHVVTWHSTVGNGGRHPWNTPVVNDHRLSVATTASCSDAGSPAGHTFNSLEWQFKAHLEGLANAYSAATWNNRSLSNCSYYQWLDNRFKIDNQLVPRGKVSCVGANGVWVNRFAYSKCTASTDRARVTANDAGNETDWMRAYFRAWSRGNSFASLFDLLRSTPSNFTRSNVTDLLSVASASTAKTQLLEELRTTGALR
jgi:hypothetical protein